MIVAELELYDGSMEEILGVHVLPWLQRTAVGLLYRLPLEDFVTILNRYEYLTILSRHSIP